MIGTRRGRWMAPVVFAVAVAVLVTACWVVHAAAGGGDGWRERLLARFRQLDANGDGSLSPNELPDAPWVKRADTNSDGTVTLDEASAAFGAAARGADEAPGADDAGLLRREWQVEGVAREALVYVPRATGDTAAPCVFAFHGHGGTARHAAWSFGYHRIWPEAVVVYMQGLPTPGIITDPEGVRAGWQKTGGDQGDRDLKFFDAVLATVRSEYRVDPKRIYVTGHSNGGAFTYLLWAARGDAFAAVAPSAGGAVRSLSLLEPLPAMHIAGENDELVPYRFQVRTMTAVRRVNGCNDTAAPWATAGPLTGVIYASPSGTPFVALTHPGSHKFPEAAPELVVRFFKEHAKP